MDTINRAYKKLTNANGAVRVFSIIALVLATIGTLLEPLARTLYNMIFTNDVKYLLVSKFKEYLKISQWSIIFFVMSLVLVVAAFSSKHKKNIGQGFGSLFVLVPAAAAIVPVIDMIDYLDSGSFNYLYSESFKYYMNGADNLKFHGISILLVYLIPICIAVLFVICGIILVCKASGEKPTEITYVPTKIKNRAPAPQQGFAPYNQFNQQPNGFAQPQGFNNPNTVGGFGAASFGASNDNTRSPFAKPQTNAVPASAPVMDDVKTSATAEIPIVHNDPAPEKTEEPKTAQKICSECGTVLADNAKFCKTCGRPV